jgi:hypothetical protein
MPRGRPRGAPTRSRRSPAGEGGGRASAVWQWPTLAGAAHSPRPALPDGPLAVSPPAGRQDGWRQVRGAAGGGGASRWPAASADADPLSSPQQRRRRRRRRRGGRDIAWRRAGPGGGHGGVWVSEDEGARRAAGATAAARPRPRPIPQPPATLLLPLSSWKACARRAAAPPSRCVRACGRLGLAGPRARPGTRCRSRGEERGGGGNTVTLWPGKRARRDPFFFLLYFSPSRSFPAAARHQKSAGPTHKNEHTKIKSPPAV